MDVLLAVARDDDTLTLFHLLPRVDAADRERLVARLERLEPRPPSVPRDAVLSLDRDALDAWGRELRIYW